MRGHGGRGRAACEASACVASACVAAAGERACQRCASASAGLAPGVGHECGSSSVQKETCSSASPLVCTPSCLSCEQ